MLTSMFDPGANWHITVHSIACEFYGAEDDQKIYCSHHTQKYGSSGQSHIYMRQSDGLDITFEV